MELKLFDIVDLLGTKEKCVEFLDLFMIRFIVEFVVLMCEFRGGKI